LSRTTRVSRYQKGKTNLDFTEARDSEWHWHQLGYMQVCTSLQTDNHASSTHHSVFYRPDALPAAQPTASKQGTDIAVKTTSEYITSSAGERQPAKSRRRFTAGLGDCRAPGLGGSLESQSLTMPLSREQPSSATRADPHHSTPSIGDNGCTQISM